MKVILPENDTEIFEDLFFVRFKTGIIWIYISVSIVVLVWFTIGGFKDVREMIARLSVMKRDDEDTGVVR